MQSEKTLTVPDRRASGIRRDLNGLFRGKDGEISGSKLGTYAGQIIAAKMLLNSAAMPTWDVLSVLFLVLIAPEAYKQLLAMRWGGGMGQSTTRTDTYEKTTQETVSRPATKPVQKGK